jgi:D-serine dehydratase
LAVALRLEAVLGTIVDDQIKGVPGGVKPTPLRELGQLGWNVVAEDLPLPLLVMKDRDLRSNIQVMRDYCQRHRVQLAPHGKTTMAPQLFDLQLRAGAWGITAATVEQVQVYRRFGVERVLFANQLVGKQATRFICQELRDDPGFEFSSWVDSPGSVELLAQARRDWHLPRRFPVLIEIGHPAGRAGVRSAAQLDAVLRAIDEHDSAVELAGVAAFEGLLDTEAFAGIQSVQPGALSVESYLESVVQATSTLLARGALPDGFILTAGGSTSFGAVVDSFTSLGNGPATVVLRSGCYIAHDHLMNARTSPLSLGNSAEASEFGHLSAALELWAHVQSIPEDGLSLLTFGRRDAPFDYGLPIPLRRYPAGSDEAVAVRDAAVVALNDQHAYMRGGGKTAVGDRIVLGISHPCTAFDKWRLVPVVDDAYNVTGGVLTYF